MGLDPVGANLVFARFSLPRYASTDSKPGEYEIRPYVTISERVGSRACQSVPEAINSTGRYLPCGTWRLAAAILSGVIGRARTRAPTAAKSALATAGAIGGTPVSPIPPGFSVLFMI